MPTVLSQTAEYALRAAAWLAAESPDAPVRTRDLSRGTGIPEPYLAKILRRLVLASSGQVTTGIYPRRSISLTG
jgi:DNA-binding IscR family transcriptional regulator